MTNIDPAELGAIAAKIAFDVGSEVGRRREAGFSWTTKSTSTDVVTEIDTWAETAVVERIDAERPDDGLLGEEGAHREGTTGVVWVIDPVDGTTNLLYGLAGFSVSIGVEVDGVAVAGAVYDPIRDELFVASLGNGATRNGDPIAPTSLDQLASALVATGFSYSPEDRAEQALALRTVLPRVRDIRRNGGAALDFCAVACGRVDAYFERGIKPWDGAAGRVIASEAGAVVRMADMTMVATPGIANALRELLTEADA